MPNFLDGQAFIPSVGGGGGGGSTVSDAGVGLAVPGTTLATGTVVFSNSNNVSFGLNGSTITASASFVQTPFALSAAGGSQSTGTVSFANGGGVSFGYNAGTITASIAAAVETPFGLSAGTQSISTGTLVFSNSNGVTFGMSGSSRVTASFSSVVFSNSNNITFGLNAGTLTASVTVVATAETPFGISAGTQSISTGTMVFSNSNGVTFGMSGSSRITASYSQSTAPNAIAINAAGSVTAGTAVFSNSNNVTFGLNGSTITASVTVAATVFSNSNNVTFGLNGSTITASVTVAAGAPFGISAGTQSISTGTMVFSNSNGVTFGMSGSSRITASYSQSTAPNAIAINAAGSVTAGTVVFSNSNNVTFGLNGSTVTATASFAAGGNALSFWENGVGGGTFSTVLNASSMTVDRLWITGSLAATVFVKHAIYGASDAAGPTAISVWHSTAIGTFNMTPGEYLIAHVMSYSNAGNRTVSATGFVAVYTMGGSTASLASSGSQSKTFVLANNALGTLSATFVGFGSAVGGVQQASYFYSGAVSTNTPPASFHLTNITATLGALAGQRAYAALAGTF